jgi:hypothetical protein
MFVSIVCEYVSFLKVVVIFIVDSEFWLVLPVDVGLRLMNHVK